MKYSELPTGYKTERFGAMMRNLNNGETVNIRTLYLEEIKMLKALYGKELKQNGELLYRVPKEVVL